MVKERLDARARRGVAAAGSSASCSTSSTPRHKFAPPPSLVEEEFNNVWKTIVDDLQSRKRTFADEDTTEEKAKEEYRGIAERRVRLGLVLAEIGERNNIKVTDEEMSRAVMERARQVPGPRAGGLGFLPQESRRAGEPARADLRGQGGRLHPRARQGDRQDGLARGTLQGRRGLTGRAASAPVLRRATVGLCDGPCRRRPVASRSASMPPCTASQPAPFRARVFVLRAREPI